jgi:hypothetical protein
VGRPCDTALGDTYQFRKFTCSNIEVIPDPFRQLIRDLRDPSFPRLLELLTGIPKPIPDPYLKGGGLHMSGPGGVLAPHTDFHLHEPLALYRRINVLVYLNGDWEESYGGCLQLGTRRTRPRRSCPAGAPRWSSPPAATSTSTSTDSRALTGAGKWARSTV